MISIKDKPTKTKKKMITEMNVAEKSIEIAHDRGLGTEDLLKYDVVPSPMLFDDDQLMTKPGKSQLIRELEDKLKSDDYSYRHKPESACIIDVMAAVCRLPLSPICCPNSQRQLMYTTNMVDVTISLTYIMKTHQ